jgi:hypothetical protein
MTDLIGQYLGRYHILEQLGLLPGMLRDGWEGGESTTTMIIRFCFLCYNVCKM